MGKIIRNNIEYGGGKSTGSGTTNYSALTNKPSINNVTLEGNKTLDDLGISSYDDTELKTQIQNLINDMGDIDNLNIVGVTDLVSAINKVSLQYVDTIIYDNTNKKYTITYKNGRSIDVETTQITSNLRLGDISNVDETGALDKQLLGYDAATDKFIPMTMDTSSVLKEAKQYTDDKVGTLNRSVKLVADEKPIYDNGTISYIQNGTTLTTENLDTWFYYKVDGSASQTTFIDGVEFTIENISDVDMSEYVNKNTDVTSSFTGEETDTSKITDVQALKDLLSIINNKLSDKINVSDIVDDLIHADSNKPASANQVYLLRKMIEDVTVNISGGASVVVKKYINNIVANTSYSFDSVIALNECAIINCYSAESGSTNQTGSLKEFNSNTSSDFIDNNIIIDDNGVKVKDEYTINSTINSNGYYETEVINRNDFIEIVGIEG